MNDAAELAELLKDCRDRIAEIVREVNRHEMKELPFGPDGSPPKYFLDCEPVPAGELARKMHDANCLFGKLWHACVVSADNTALEPILERLEEKATQSALLARMRPNDEAYRVKRVYVSAQEYKNFSTAIRDCLRELGTEEGSANQDGDRQRPQDIFASATDPIPDAYKQQNRPCGPMTESRTDVARAISGRKNAKAHEVERHHNRKLFIRWISERKCEAYFRSFAELHEAEACLKKLRNSPQNDDAAKEGHVG